MHISLRDTIPPSVSRMASEPGQKALEVIIIQWGQRDRDHKLSCLEQGVLSKSVFTGLKRALAQGQAVTTADGVDGGGGHVGVVRDGGPDFKIHQTRVICLPC